MNEDDIRRAMRDVAKKRRTGDAKPVSRFVDVYAFENPAGRSVSVSGGCDLVLAAVNYGPEYIVEVRYSAKMVNGAIRLEGATDGTISLGAVLDGGGDDVNWRECEMRAVLPKRREDCRCDWAVPEFGREWTYTTVTKHVTEDF